MLTSYFPYLTYAVPAVCGLFIILPLIEAGRLWAAGAYIVSAALSVLFAEPQSALLYVFLFGFYPILKAIIEAADKPVLEWVIKLAAFNLSALLMLAAFVMLFSDAELITEIKHYGLLMIPFVLLCEGAFVLYDIAISRVAAVYMWRVHPQIEKLKKH